MTTTKLDLTGLKCPLPALKTRKALKSVAPGDFLEVHCTDPLSVIDIPNLIRETGDKVEVMPDDYGKIRVAGEIVALSPQHVAIHRNDTIAGDVVVHFPRAGFLVLSA